MSVTPVDACQTLRGVAAATSGRPYLGIHGPRRSDAGPRARGEVTNPLVWLCACVRCRSTSACTPSPEAVSNSPHRARLRNLVLTLEEPSPRHNPPPSHELRA